MARHEDMSDSQIERLLGALEPFDVADEAHEMLAPRAEHPAAYDLERYATGDLHEEARHTWIASHVATCETCRAEVSGWRALLQPIENGASRVAVFPAPGALRPRLIVPVAAAASSLGGRRSGQGVLVHVIEPPALPSLRVIAIQLDDRTLRPRQLRVLTPSGEVLEQALPPADSNGVIQFMRTIASPADQAFIELILTAELEFVDASEA